MMYIRTKNGRIIGFGEKYAYPTRLSNGKTYFSFQELTEDSFEVMKEYNHWEILKQSENLEELCDQIVYNGYLYQNKIAWDGCLIEDNFEELGEHITDEMIKKGIYGAIWTEWGLKYVAKMNDDGELELI